MRPDFTVALSFILAVAAVYVGVLRLIDMNEKEPVWALVLLLGLGAVAAGGAALAVQTDVRTDTPAGVAVTAESAKFVAIAIGMAVLATVERVRGWPELNGFVDSLTYGAAAGFGFAMGDGLLRETFASAAEQQTPDETGLPELLWMTLQGGTSEALFGAILGAGLGALFLEERSLLRIIAAPIGLVLATFAHWGYAAWILDDAQIRATATAGGVVATLLLLAAVAAAMLYGLAREAGQIGECLEPEIATGAITAEEVDLLRNPSERHRRYGRAFVRGDLDGWLRQRALQDRQVQLALALDRLGTARSPKARQQLARRIDSIREAIKNVRSSGRARGRMRRRAALLAIAALATVAGASVLVAAGGDEAPTTFATRSAVFKREQADIGRPDRPVLRLRIRHLLGSWRLVGTREHAALLVSGAREAYRLDYARAGGAQVGYAIADYASPRRASRARDQFTGQREQHVARLLWGRGSHLSMLAGAPRAVADFCSQIAEGGPPPRLDRARAVLRRILPRAWQDNSNENSLSFSRPGAFILGDLYPAPGLTSGEFARGATLLDLFTGYRAESVESLGFRSGREAFRSVFEWRGRTDPVQDRYDALSYVDCGSGYVFIAAAPPGEYERFAALFQRTFEALHGTSNR